MSVAELLALARPVSVDAEEAFVWPQMMAGPVITSLWEIYARQLAAGPSVPPPQRVSFPPGVNAGGQVWAMSRLRSPSLDDLEYGYGKDLANYLTRARSRATPPPLTLRLRHSPPLPLLNAAGIVSRASQAGTPAERHFWKSAGDYARRYISRSDQADRPYQQGFVETLTFQQDVSPRAVARRKRSLDKTQPGRPDRHEIEPSSETVQSILTLVNVS